MADPIFLNLGCGDRRLPGFVNADTEPGADIQLDLTQGLSYGPGSVSAIYSEGFIERLSQAQGTFLLAECRRVLRPGGILRIATVDLAQLLAGYETGTAPSGQRLDWAATPCERFNVATHEDGRQWLYDEAELVRVGGTIGLTKQGRYQPGESPYPLMRGLEQGDSASLVIEFQKPNRRLRPDETPLVTIAIPAYNPRYFRQALKSALAQTYSNFEVVICDDCESPAIEETVADVCAGDSRVRYLRNPPEIARKEYGRENYLRCFREAKGEFLKFLNDDDLLAPECVEKMVRCFTVADDVTLATSKRQMIDADGNHLPDLPATTAPVEHDAIIGGLALGAQILMTGRNIIGEPTTVMFRKAELDDVSPDPLSMDGQKLIGVSDLAMWLNLLAKGNAAYLVEPLSIFRRHEQQVQVASSGAIRTAAESGWAVIKNSWLRRGLVRLPQAKPE